MVIVTITANFVAAFFIEIIIMGVYQTSAKAYEGTKYYRHCLWTCFLGLIFEGFSYLLDGRPEYTALLYLLNYFTYIFIDLVTVTYTFYIHSLVMERDGKPSRKFLLFQAGLCIMDIFFLTAGTLSGGLFVIKDGYYIYGSWDFFIEVIPEFCIFCLFIFLISKRKVLGFRNMLILCAYLIMPGLSAVLRLFIPDLEFGYVGFALALAFIYVKLLSTMIAESNVRAQLYNSLSTKDILTGLKNRRGYEEILGQIGEKENMGMVFCDANSLKAVNDNEGHEAGDQLLQKLSDILKESFSDAEICRIGGDEFVIVFRNLDQEGFDERMAIFAEKLKSNDRIASFGYAFGEGGGMKEIVQIAERMMYDDKSRYYKETGKDRRG
ncbi:MAG: GGDEF domain-containing protein [Lachnospiraceae bacterium]|nr:GGDEF domain-containing protein [Lachnospiraceae bacterium]